MKKQLDTTKPQVTAKKTLDFKFNNQDLKSHIEKIVENFKSNPDNYGDAEMMPQKGHAKDGNETTYFLDVPNVEESYLYVNRDDRDKDFETLGQLIDFVLANDPQPTVGELPETLTDQDINIILTALMMAKTRYNTTDNGGKFMDFTFASIEDQNKYAQKFKDAEIKIRASLK
jgi:hypothetical protein